MYKRLAFVQGSPEASCFILGPRQTGKTTFLRNIPCSIRYDLLIGSEFVRLNRNPDIIYQECQALTQEKKHIVWVDEVQKIPALLDSIHRVIEDCKSIDFILSGSSARKLKGQAVNLLGGRALDYKFHPLTMEEIGEHFKLDLALEYGTLPRIYTTAINSEVALAKELLSAYVTLYLEEEIKKEALVRELLPFQRFLEVAAQSTANTINMSKIADDAQVTHYAVSNYFSILEDTMLGFFLPSFHISIRKQLSKHPKFYFFDNGVNRAILNRLESPANGLERGALFEQFIVQEVRRVVDYYRKKYRLYFWRTSSGAEVDLLICTGTTVLLAIECKASNQVHSRDLAGLKAFKEEHPHVQTVICATVPRDIEIETGYPALTPASLIQKIKDLTHTPK